MLEPMTDVTQPEGYIRYARSVALTRLALVACFVVLLALYTPWPIALLGAVEFGLYLALLVATEIYTLSLHDALPIYSRTQIASRAASTCMIGSS